MGEFQVAGMTERIRYLTAHLKMHPKDFSTRRGLVAVVNKRRRLLNFLADENRIRYEEVKSEMGIRHRAPSKVQTKDKENEGRTYSFNTFDLIDDGHVDISANKLE